MARGARSARRLPQHLRLAPSHGYVWRELDNIELVGPSGLRFYDVMRGGAALILFGIVAYSAGRQNVLSSSALVPIMTSPPVLVMAQAASPDPSFSSNPAPGAKAAPSGKPEQRDNKSKVDAALTAAAIAAVIVKASRDRYHDTGKPCACPDDRARDGSACGGRSAYSRPGGAAPLCYPTDVTAAMIDSYRQKVPPH